MTRYKSAVEIFVLGSKLNCSRKFFMDGSSCFNNRRQSNPQLLGFVRLDMVVIPFLSLKNTGIFPNFELDL